MRRMTAWAAVLAAAGWGCAERARVAGDGAPAADHVYTFCLNSPNDPMQLTGFRGTAEKLKGAGFVNTMYVPRADPADIAKQVRRIKREDPRAKVVLVGWSGASLWCWDVAELVAGDGIVIDNIIYLDSQWLIDRLRTGKTHPQNVRGVTMLYRRGHEPPEVGVATVVHVIPTENHVAVATHAETVRRMREVMAGEE